LKSGFGKKSRVFRRKFGSMMPAGFIRSTFQYIKTGEPKKNKIMLNNQPN
jgi:hypothetical protein